MAGGRGGGRGRPSTRLGALVLLCALAGSTAAASAATPADVAATVSLREAELTHAQALTSAAGASAHAGGAYVDALAAACRGVLKGAPERDEEGPAGLHSARRRGELARAEHQISSAEEEANAGFFDASEAPLAGANGAFQAAVAGLTWSDPRIAGAVRFEASLWASGPPLTAAGVCADLRSWAASGFTALAAGTKAFEAAREKPFAEPPGSVPPQQLLKPTESPAARRIEARILKLYRRLGSRARGEVEGLARVAKVLGEPPEQYERTEHEPVIARGRSHSGEKIVIRGGGKSSGGPSCKHPVTVEFTRAGHGIVSNTGETEDLCLPARQMFASGFGCGEGRERIVIVMAARVRGVRLTLSDGSTIDEKTFEVPRSAGGPAAIYAESLNKYEPHPVSLTEIDASGATVRTVKVPAVDRCSRRPKPVGPKFIPLAKGTTATGVGYTVEGVFVRFGRHKSFSVSVSTDTPGPGVGFSEFTSLPRGHVPAFPLQLSSACQPQAYWIVYGLLAPPGASVLVRTAAGATQLASVAIPAQYGADGPLEYGVFDSPPLEVTVKRADGTTLTAEAPVAKVVEEGQFCEGFAEP